MQHGVDAVGQVFGRRDIERNARVANLRLCADDALSQCGRSSEKCTGDGFGREIANFAKRECNLPVGRKRGVAASEDEAEPIVFDVVAIGRRSGARGLVELFGDFGERGIKPGAAADGVDRFEAAGRDEPCAGIVGHAFFWPLFHCRGEGIVKGFFGEVEVAEQADERGEHAARLGAVNGVDFFADAVRFGGTHLVIVCSLEPVAQQHYAYAVML